MKRSRLLSNRPAPELGKRVPPRLDPELTKLDEVTVPIPLKKVKREETTPVSTPRNITEAFGGELQTPRPAPALNINLIDSTYQFKEVIDNMWEDTQTREQHFKNHYQSGDEQFDEFELKEEFN